jgi:hypothetical protein
MGASTNYTAVLEGFRGVYRTAWGRPAMQRLLRHGAHWMVPDDHDIENALGPLSRPGIDSGMPGHTLGFLSSYLPKRPSLVALPLTPAFVRAGLRAALEYQLQLRVDIPLSPEEGLVGMQPFYGFHTRGQTAFVLLDLRLARTFSPEHEHALLTTPQWEAVLAQMAAWERDPSIKNMV